jgi:hypothetical protein
MTDAECLAVNQAKILVGGYRNGKGCLLLWDDYSDGWLSQIELEQVPQSITPYGGNGFVVNIGNKFIYTDGYSTQDFATIPDTDIFGQKLNLNFNNVKTFGDKLIVSAAINQFKRNKTGVYVFEPANGWTFVPFHDGVGYPTYLASGKAGAIMLANSNYYSYLFSSFKTGGGTATNCVCSVDNIGSTISSAIFNITLPKEVNVKKVVLRTAHKYDQINYGASNITITLNAGDSKKAMFGYTELGTSNSTTSLKNSQGVSYGGFVGQEVRIMNGQAAGSRTYITAIADGGTANEVWTVSPALPYAPTNGAFVQMFNLKLQETRTISSQAIPENLEFDVRGIYTNNLILEFILTAAGSNLLDIVGVDIYS